MRRMHALVVRCFDNPEYVHSMQHNLPPPQGAVSKSTVTIEGSRQTNVCTRLYRTVACSIRGTHAFSQDVRRPRFHRITTPHIYVVLCVPKSSGIFLQKTIPPLLSAGSHSFDPTWLLGAAHRYTVLFWWLS